MRRPSGKIALALAILLLGGGYILHARSGQKPGPMQGQGSPMPVMPVKVAVAEKRPLSLWTSFPGHLTAVDFVAIRPQVSGRIDQVKFEDGQTVKKGDLLFVIDPRPYQASVQQAQAAVEGAGNRYALATKDLERAQGLIATDAISQRLYDERRNAAEVAKSDLTEAEALLAKAKVSLDYAYIKSPISGRISRAEITAGNLVESGPNAPMLATIVSNQGIYADFEIDEQTYRDNIQSGDDLEKQNIPVTLTVEKGKSAYEGHIKSFDNRIDPSSGTIRARAYFENPGNELLPGMFVTVNLASPSTEEGILLTEQAIGTDQDRKFVYVVDDTGKVAYRQVELGASTEGKRVIRSGLEPGDRIAVEGISKLRPGMAVSPQLEKQASESPALLPESQNTEAQ